MFETEDVCRVVRTLTLRQKVSRCFWAVGQCRQLVTWQLECHSVQECAGHYMLLTLHLSHPKHDWFDCRVSWRGLLSDPQGPNGIQWFTCKVQVGCIQPQHFSALYCTWCCTSFCQKLSESTCPSYTFYGVFFLLEKSHTLVKSEFIRHGKHSIRHGRHLLN